MCGIPLEEGGEATFQSLIRTLIFYNSFRKRYSTIDAIKSVVDLTRNAISGSQNTNCMCSIIAFNSTGWVDIMTELEELKVPLYLKKIISRYFSNRILVYDTDESIRFHNCTGGIPQGS